MKKTTVFILATICLAGVSCRGVDAEICKYHQGREAAVSLTFDDGLIDRYTLVAAELNHLGMQGTSGVDSAFMGRDGSRLTWDMCSDSTYGSMSRWLRKVIDGGEWGVMMTHGIRIGQGQKEGESELKRFYRELSGKRDSVWVDVFAHVASYITERDHCTISVKKSGRTLSITPSCTLDASLYRQPLTARVKIGEDVLYLDFDPFGGTQTYDLSDPLLGRTLNIIGDSYVRNHLEPMQYTWHYKAAARHSMVYNNYGINGSSIAFDRSDRGFGVSMLDRFTRMSHEADYILVVAGHNDAGYITEHPDSTDVLMERLDLFCRGLKEQYPGAKLGFVTPWAVDRPNFPEVIAAIHNTCDKYGIKVLDAVVTGGIKVNDPDFRKRYFQRQNDTAHLNAAGHDLLVDWGDAFLRSL